MAMCQLLPVCQPASVAPASTNREVVSAGHAPLCMQAAAMQAQRLLVMGRGSGVNLSVSPWMQVLLLAEGVPQMERTAAPDGDGEAACRGQP